MRGFCVFSLGPGHQKWKQESSKQADGAGSKGDQRAGRPSFGEGNFKRADFMKVGLFLITDPQSNRGMCDLHERQNDGDLYENADTQSNHVHQIFWVHLTDESQA